MPTNRRQISYREIDTQNGESLASANEKIEEFFKSLKTEWLGYMYVYNDANSNQVINVPITQLHPAVQRFIAEYWFDVTDPPNLIMEKIFDLPVDYQMDIYNNYFDPRKLHQKTGLGAEVRALYLNSNTGLYTFASGKDLYNTYSDFTGILGNYHPDDNTVDIILNGMYYDFSRESLIPGKTYFLSDSMPGWLIPYQEGGKNQNLSVPMSVAVGKHAAILLTERTIVKDLPCGSVGTPTDLRFAEYLEYVDVTNGDPLDDPNETVYYGYEPIGQ